MAGPQPQGRPRPTAPWLSTANGQPNVSATAANTNAANATANGNRSVDTAPQRPFLVDLLSSITHPPSSSFTSFSIPSNLNTRKRPVETGVRGSSPKITKKSKTAEKALPDPRRDTIRRETADSRGSGSASNSPVLTHGHASRPGSGASTPTQLAPPAPAMVPTAPMTRTPNSPAVVRVPNGASALVKVHLNDPSVVPDHTGIASLRAVRVRKAQLLHNQNMAIQQNANNAQLVANSDKAVTTSQSSEALGIEVSLLKEDLKKKDTGLREMHDSIESLKKAVLGTSAQTGQIKHLADAVELIRKDLKENNVSLTDAQTSQVKDLVVITRSISNQLSDIHTEQAHQRNQLSGIHTEQAHQRNHGKQLSDNIKQNKSMFFQEINSVKAKFSDMDQLRDRLGRFEKSLDTVISVPEQLSSLHRSAQSLEESKNALKTDYKTLQAKMTEVDYCGSRIGHVEKFQGQMNEMLAKSQDRIGAVEKTVQANSIAIQDVKDSGDASGQRLDEVLGATAQSLEKLLGATQDLKKRVKAVESDRSTGNGVADAEDIKQRITALETDIHAIKQQSAETPKAVKPKDEDEDDETSARLESVEGTLEVLRGQLPVWMKDIKDDITFSVNQKIKEIESKLEQSDVSTRMQNVEHRVLFLDVEAQGMKLNVNSLLTKVHALSTKAVEIENRGTQIENRNQEMINALQKDLQNVGGFTARIEMLERKAPPPPAVLAAQIGDDVCMRVKQQIKQEITRELQPRFQEIYNTRETDMFVVRNLEERYQNITTEAIYKQMVHWIQRTYPQAPDFLARLNALQNELHQERAKVRAMIQQEQLERTNANNEVRGHSDASVARIEKGLENMQAVHTNSQRELRTEFMGLVGRVSTAETRVTQVQQDVTKVQQDVKTFEAGLRKAIGDESRDRLAADTQLTSRTDGIQFKVNNLVDDSEDLVQKLKALESDTKEIVGYKGDIKTACGRLPFLEAWLGKLQAVIKALNDNSSHPLEDIEFNASKR